MVLLIRHNCGERKITVGHRCTKLCRSVKTLLQTLAAKKLKQEIIFESIYLFLNLVLSKFVNIENVGCQLKEFLLVVRISRKAAVSSRVKVLQVQSTL